MGDEDTVGGALETIQHLAESVDWDYDAMPDIEWTNDDE